MKEGDGAMCEGKQKKLVFPGERGASICKLVCVKVAGSRKAAKSSRCSFVPLGSVEIKILHTRIFVA